MSKVAFVVSLVGLFQAGSAQAQSAYYWPAPAALTKEAQRFYLPMGTPLNLVTRTQVSTKDNKPGDRFYLEVAENVSYRGQIIIPAGAPAVAEVTRSDRNGHFGKKGKLDVRLLYVETPHGPVRLTGRAADEGKSGTLASFGTILFVSPLGFLIHGTSAYIPSGATVPAYLAQNLEFAYESPAETDLAAVQPDGAGAVPASFDPTVFNAAATAARNQRQRP